MMNICMSGVVREADASAGHLVEKIKSKLTRNENKDYSYELWGCRNSDTHSNNNIK